MRVLPPHQCRIDPVAILRCAAVPLATFVITKVGRKLFTVVAASVGSEYLVAVLISKVTYKFTSK